jgi:hypothetical protein
MIIEEVSRHEWIDRLARRDDADFTYEAADALFDYYDGLSENIGEHISFDRIAIRCEWSEYTEDELREQYNIGHDEDVEITMIDKDLAHQVIRIPMHGRPHHYLVQY